MKLLLYLAVSKATRICISLLNVLSLPKSRKGFILMEIIGNKMYLDLADEGISRELMLDGIREYLNIADVKGELKKGDVVVDIGANIGYYALLEAQLVGDEGLSLIHI